MAEDVTRFDDDLAAFIARWGVDAIARGIADAGVDTAQFAVTMQGNDIWQAKILAFGSRRDRWRGISAITRMAQISNLRMKFQTLSGLRLLVTLEGPPVTLERINSMVDRIAVVALDGHLRDGKLAYVSVTKRGQE